MQLGRYNTRDLVARQYPLGREFLFSRAKGRLGFAEVEDKSPEVAQVPVIILFCGLSG